MGKISDDAVPAVRSWRGRRGLVLAVVLPALAIASFSTVHLVSALGSAGSAARAGALARLTADSTGLAAALEAERNETVRFVALGAPPYGVAGRGSARTSDDYQLEQAVLHGAYAATDRSARQVTAAARAIGGSYPAVVRQQATSEVAALGNLAELRRSSTTTNLPSLSIIREYTSVIRAVLAIGNNAGPGRGEEDLARAGQELTLIAGARENVAQQSAILLSALNPDLTTRGDFGPDKLSAITAAVSEQEAAQVAFDGMAATSSLGCPFG